MLVQKPGLAGRITRALRQRWRAWKSMRAARATAVRRLGGAPVRRLLVVCYGNIYRSPLFAEILRAHYQGADGKQPEIRSAGFHPRAGRSSPPEYVVQCAGHGVTLDAHRSALTTPDDLAWADTIVCMDRHNWNALDLMGADSAKIVWAGALTEGNVEILDPYGRPEPEVEHIIGRIETAARQFIERSGAPR
jgi:protein-tyrosine phosphatase